MAEVESGATNEMIAWVRLAQSGDDDAFSALVRLFHKRAISVAYRFLGNADDAIDVSQSAFLRAYRSLGQLEDPARFPAWLMRIVCNLALNYRRFRKLRAMATLDEAALRSESWMDRSTGSRFNHAKSSAASPLSEELNEAVTRAVESLPEKQRMALVLFSVEGLPQKEVADVLECSVELVKWNVFQARKKLRELLAAHL